MARVYDLGSVAGLKLDALPSAIAGSALLWVLLSGSGVLLGVSVGAAIVGGLIAVVLHWSSEIVHHLGHAWAARTTGHPMTGVRFWWVLGMSRYPRDEGVLPARVHIRRALGGPAASLVVTLVAAVVAVVARPFGGAIWLVALFFFLDNLLVFSLGAFMPLGFTDGSTLLYWWGRA
jgi:hypothetical protein